MNLSKRIIKHLTPDLVKKQFVTDHPLGGQCYVASEIFYHLSGGKNKGFKPMNIKHEGVSHWWVKGPKNEIYDLTADQFKSKVPYAESVCRGFLTKLPSKRAQILIERLNGS